MKEREQKLRQRKRMAKAGELWECGPSPVCWRNAEKIPSSLRSVQDASPSVAPLTCQNRQNKQTNKKPCLLARASTDHFTQDGFAVKNVLLSIVDLASVIFLCLQLQHLDAAAVSHLLMACCSDLRRTQKRNKLERTVFKAVLICVVALLGSWGAEDGAGKEAGLGDWAFAGFWRPHSCLCLHF